MYGKSYEIFCVWTPKMTMILLERTSIFFFLFCYSGLHFKYLIHFIVRRNLVNFFFVFLLSSQHYIRFVFIHIFNGSYIRVLKSHYIGFRQLLLIALYTFVFFYAKILLHTMKCLYDFCIVYAHVEHFRLL